MSLRKKSSYRHHTETYEQKRRWSPKIKRNVTARKIKRQPGKTQRFQKGIGKQVYVGEDITTSGWMNIKHFNEWLKDAIKVKK